MPHAVGTDDDAMGGGRRNLAPAFAPFPEGRNGQRPSNGGIDLFHDDPYWRDLVLFHEYFHGDTGQGLGASHQTGWTGLVAKLLQQSGE